MKGVKNMETVITGKQNGYSFTITREGGNKFFTFISNYHMKAEYYSYGTFQTLKKLYEFIS